MLSYNEVLGHERAKAIITKAIAGNRVPHAYLFRGPAGVGKKLFAKGVAAAVNCRNRAGTFACGECVSCKKLLSGNHPDFTFVEPDKGAIKIGQVREICREISYPPYESSTRVVVLEDVHTMRREAANSLLKTLEEPAENNLLILTAESSCEVLTTISSRCQVVPFFGLSEEETAQVMEGKDLGCNEQELVLLAKLASGSPGKALEVAGTDVLPVWNLLQDLLIDKSLYRDSEVGRWLACAEKIASLKSDVQHLFALLRLWLRDHLLFLHGASNGSALYDWDQDGRMLPHEISGMDEVLIILSDCEKKMIYNCNLALMAEVLLFKIQGLKDFR
ncbi:MAG: DNA polymerase III subunit delta' [Desulfotalea sp.]